MALRVVENALNRLFHQTKMGATIVERYKDLQGYRKIGLLSDDIIDEENEIVQSALKRLPPKVAYDRIYRLRRAMQCSLTHTQLPPNEQTKPEEDVPYLTPYINELLREKQERAELDALAKSK